MAEEIPHPFLIEPVLYVTGVPPDISDNELAQSFDTCLPVRPRLIRDDPDALCAGRVEFKSLDKGV